MVAQRCSALAEHTCTWPGPRRPTLLARLHTGRQPVPCLRRARPAAPRRGSSLAACSAAAADAPAASEQHFGGSRQVNEGSHSEDFFGRLCGEFTLQEEQLSVFQEFSRVMRQCSTAFFCVAASNIALSVLQTVSVLLLEQARERMLHEPIVMLAGITVGNFSFWGDSLLVAVLLHYGASSFKRVTDSPGGNHLPLIFQGISRLSLVFQQFAVAALAVASVHSLEAASKHPPITRVAAALFFAVAGLRSAALWWLMSKHSSVEGGGVPEMLSRLRQGDRSGVPLWERLAMGLLVGHLLAYNIPGLELKPADAKGGSSKVTRQPGGPSSGSQDGASTSGSQASSGAGSSAHTGERGQGTVIEGRSLLGAEASSSSGSGEQDDCRRHDEGQEEDAGDNEYEFTGGESQMLRILMDSMHTAGLALIIQGFSTGLLGFANFLTGNHGGAASMGYNGVSKAFTSLIIFRASQAFDRSISGTTHNVQCVLAAIGDQGLTRLFHQLTVFAWTVAVSQVLQIFLPVIKTSPAANLLTSKLAPNLGQLVTAVQNMAAGIA